MSKNITIEELKQIISEEAKALTSVKGIKDDKSDTWGGKGSANAGLKNVYGGKGSGKGGDPFGGGKRVNESGMARAAMRSIKEQRILGISNMDEIGTVMSYTVLENGSIQDYDVKFGTKLVQNIPAEKLYMLSESLSEDR